MTKRYLLFIACGLLYQHSIFAQGTWTQKANFPGPGRSVPFCFSIGTKGYVGTGSDNWAATLKDMWAWDQTTNVWTQKADFPGGDRWLAIGFSVGNKGYAGLGVDSSGANPVQFWEYDPSVNGWTQKGNFASLGRGYSVSFVINNMGYICGGLMGTGCTQYNELWQYDPSLDLWTRKANFPGTPRGNASGFSIGSKGYVGLGDNCGLSQDFWEYNAILDTWSQKANYPYSNGDAASFSICGKGYIGLGEGSGTDLWQYDPVLNHWTQKASFPGLGRDEAAFFSIGNKGYFGLGCNSGPPYYNSLYEYTPDTACVLCVPVANFSSSDSAFCSEPFRCIDFTDLSTCNATSWQWIFQGAFPDTSSLQNPTQICYSTPGTFSVTLIVANSAGSDTLTAPMITVGGTPPPPTITIVGLDTLICSPATSYQWFLNGNSISGATDSFYVAQQWGTYSVRITDGFGCTRLSAGVEVGVNELSNLSGISIFPNPVTSQLAVSNLQLAKETTVTIYNVLGEKVASPPAALQRRREQEATLDVSSLSNGLYWIEISDGEKIYRSKFIKQ